MPYTPIDNELFDGNDFDEMPLSSAVTVTLADNAQYSARNRLKRHVIDYTPLGSIPVNVKSTPPASTSGLTGETMIYGWTDQTDPNSIGLQFSTPAQDILTLPPILWPLSAEANQMKITLNMRSDNGDMDVYVFGRLNGSYIGIPVTEVTFPDDDGIIQFNDTATSSGAYKQVGTSQASFSYGTPVVLTLTLPETNVDYSFQNDGIDDSNIATVSITVASVPDPPTANLPYAAGEHRR